MEEGTAESCSNPFGCVLTGCTMSETQSTDDLAVQATFFGAAAVVGTPSNLEKLKRSHSLVEVE